MDAQSNEIVMVLMVMMRPIGVSKRPVVVSKETYYDWSSW
jgi:hypothetical protein